MYLFIFEWDVKMCYYIPGTILYRCIKYKVMEYGEDDGIFNAV